MRASHRGHNISLIYKTETKSVTVMLVQCRHTHRPHSNLLSVDIDTAWSCTDFHFPCIHRVVRKRVL